MKFTNLNLLYFLVLFLMIFSCDKKETANSPNILFCISDDQTWLHAGAYDDNVVKTPVFDQIANEGILFNNAFTSVPACAPSRAAILTGRNFYELEEAACHFSLFPEKFKVYTEILEEHGYASGYTGKPWGPGRWEQSGRAKNPAGNEFNDLKHETPDGISNIDYAENFKAFYNQKGNKPFCFWFGAMEAHRPFPTGKGLEPGMDISRVKVPDFLPNSEKVKSDILDYYCEIEWFDTQLGKIIDFLKEKGEYENTLIVITSDNGMPFPRAKSNLYEYGIHMPLAISWKDIVQPGRSDALVSFADFAPTFLDAAGIEIPNEMTGKSLLPLLTGKSKTNRDFVVSGKELHAWCHPEGEINPLRSIRNSQYLYILNLKPEMWPAGHPDPICNWDLLPYGDIDWGPSKEEIMDTLDYGNKFLELCVGKRPKEELYDVLNDPVNLNNLADNPRYNQIKQELHQKLMNYLEETGDPRILGNPEIFDNAPYFFSHGMATGGLRPEQWKELSPEEKKEQKKEAEQLMENKLKRMQENIFN